MSPTVPKSPNSFLPTVFANRFLAYNPSTVSSHVHIRTHIGGNFDFRQMPKTVRRVALMLRPCRLGFSCGRFWACFCPVWLWAVLLDVARVFVAFSVPVACVVRVCVLLFVSRLLFLGSYGAIFGAFFIFWCT